MVCVSAPLEFCKFVCGLISTCRVQKCAVRTFCNGSSKSFSFLRAFEKKHEPWFRVPRFRFWNFFNPIYVHLYKMCHSYLAHLMWTIFCEPWGQERVIMSLHCGLKRPTLHEVAWYRSRFTWPLGSLSEIPAWWLCVSVSFPSKAQWYPQWRQSIS